MSISRGLDKKAVVYIYNGVLLSHYKEYIWISSNEVDEIGAYYTEWSKPERKTPIHYESESEVAQSCLTLWDSMDYSLSGSSIHGIFQARVPEWIAIFFSRGSSRPRNRTLASHIVGRRITVWATKEAQERFKELLIREGKGYRDQGGAVKKKQWSLEARSWFGFKGYI